MIFNPFIYPEALTGNYRRDILEMSDISFFEINPIVNRANRNIKRYSRNKVLEILVFSIKKKTHKI